MPEAALQHPYIFSALLIEQATLPAACCHSDLNPLPAATSAPVESPAQRKFMTRPACCI